MRRIREGEAVFMKTLIVEDDFLSRSLLSTLLSTYGDCHVAVNGAEAVKAVERAFSDGEPYDLICLDIMMPVMDGQQALIEIRKIEENCASANNTTARIIMVTALDDSKNIMQAFHQGQCDAYLTKPVDREKLLTRIRDLGLIE